MSLPAPASRVAVSTLGDAWASVFDAAGDIVAWVGADFRYRYVNRAVEAATGRSASDFIGHTNEEIGLSAAETTVWRERLSEAVRSARAVLFEFDFTTPEGIRRFQSSAAPLMSPEGTVESLLVISRDITDTRALRLLEGAVHHLPTAVALVEAPSGRLLLRNSQATEIFRVDPTPLSGVDTYRKFVGYHPDGREYLPQEWPLSRSIATGEVVVSEVAEIQRGDGSRGVIRMTSAPLRDANGAIIAGLVTFDDVTDEAKSDRQQRLLAAATALLAESLEVAEVLTKLARLTVPAVADFCAVHTIRDGRIELVAIEHRDPERRAAALEMTSRYPARGQRAVSQVLSGGPSELYPVITDDILQAAAADDTHLAYLRTVGYRSAMVVPIRGRSGVIASMTFTTADTGRSFDRTDLVFAEDLASRAGLALENARLYEDERTARAEAETLLRVGSALASTLELKEILQIVTDESTTITGAEFGAFFYNGVTEAGDAFPLYTLSGAPAEAFAKFPAPRATAVFGPTFRGEGIIRLDDVTADPRYGKSGPHYGMPPGHLPVRSYLAVPVRSRSGEVLGGLFFGHSLTARFEARHERLVAGVAAQAAVAIDNARLFERARAAEASQARRAEELRVAEERLRLAVEGANVGLWHYDLVSGELLWDTTLRAQFGVAPDATVSVDDFYRLVHADDVASVKDATATAIERRESYDVEYRIGPCDDPRWIRSLASAAYSSDGTPTRMDGITIDITDRKRIDDEHAVLLQREQAARSEGEAALKVRDDFLAAASHELRNPLNALQLQVVGLRRVAQRDPSALAKPTMTGRLDRTEEQITRLVRLVDTLLDVSRIKSGRLDLEYADVDLVAATKTVVQQLEPMIDGVTISIAATGRIVGRWDPLRLEQALTNLVSNALKYGDGKPVEICLSQEAGRASIKVTDQGIGIPSDMVHRLFARFERLSVDHRRGGFGLGLWITRQIVTAMGGDIEVRSQLGMGSTFCVELPLLPQPTENWEHEDDKQDVTKPRSRDSDN